jgi:hypothetical protein
VLPAIGAGGPEYGKGWAMARAIWSGYITFGLVSVPVGLYSATQEHELDFHQFQRGTSDGSGTSG